MELEPGTWIDGRYKILRLLGKGSEGSVYLAFQEKLFRFYAIKEVNKEGICFSRESVEVWKTLQCDGLPEIVDILEEKDLVWIVMEYIEGCNLQDYLRQTEKLCIWQAVDWCIQLVEVLEYLHRQEPPILYGDLKPENLIIRKDRIVMADMGSLIRQGSGGKRTGTREYTLLSLAEETGDEYSFGKLMEILADHCQSRQLKKLSETVMQKAQKGKTGIFKSAKSKLIKLKKQKKKEKVLLCMTVIILIWTGHTVIHQIWMENQKEEYISRISELQNQPIQKKRKQLIWLIADNPQRKEAYLELLGTFREDLEMDQEEDHMYRKLWKEIPEGRTENYEELLRKSPEDYQEVAYESGITYWYFYKGIQSRQYASVWFQKVTEMPELIGSDTDLREKSFLYKKLGEYREKWKRYDETGEREKIFSDYWQDISQLLKENENSISMVRMLLWKDALAAWQHYMVELQEEGVQRKEIEVLLQQMQEEMKYVPEGHQRMQALKKQLLEEKEQICKMMTRIYE